MPSATDPPAALPLTLDLDDFKGDFSFDALFGTLVDELLPEFRGDDAPGAPPPPPPVLGAAPPVFPAVDELLGLFKHSCKELVDLRRQIDKRLQNLKKEVATQDAKHRKTLGEVSFYKRTLLINSLLLTIFARRQTTITLNNTRKKG
jgi:hypothetical protein